MDPYLCKDSRAILFTCIQTLYDVSILHDIRAYVGGLAVVIVADTDILKQVMVKEFDSFMERTVRIT